MKEDLLRRCEPIEFPICNDYCMQFNLFAIEFYEMNMHFYTQDNQNKINMIKIVFFIINIFLAISLSAQDIRYTHDAENGYMWQDFEKRMIAKDLKYDFLSAMLDNQKIKKLSGNYKNELDCDTDLNFLQQKTEKEIDLHLIVKMIDKFYSDKDNLIVPINYAYCYCIKELAGNKSEKLEAYREKIISFSKAD